MLIGIPKEIKGQEARVALLPDHVEKLVARNHQVFVGGITDAGKLAGASDEGYLKAGAKVLSNADVFEQSQLICKVKEILPEEYTSLKEQHILLTNLHAAANKELLDIMLETKLVSLSLENTHQFGSPNCPLAGELGALEAVKLSLASYGGSGRHFMSHFGAKSSKTIVIGLGQVGKGALRTLLSLGVEVIGVDISQGSMDRIKLS